jgi:preprotein translocase subunit SecA
VVKFISNLKRKLNSQSIKSYKGTVSKIAALENDLEILSDTELIQTTERYRASLRDGTPIEEITPGAFASIRESARRNVGMRHFDVQLIGGLVLNEGKIAEMRTGEGKTLVATLAAYLNALNGTGTHIVTVNDYLAKRDALWMGPVYTGLGMSVGFLQNGSSYIFDSSTGENCREVERSDAYNADITYGTNSEFGFDYLRDNMALSEAQKVQRELAYAIVDEVDYILIDEARTPLIISSPAQEPSENYSIFAALSPKMKKDEDFTIDEKTRSIRLSEAGISKIEKQLGLNNLYAQENFSLVHFVENALKAQFVFTKNKEYVVTDQNEIVIVDEFTGRLMPGRRYSDGLHQALEAKERVPLQKESLTLATITLQNYFRMYTKLSGMTGTAMTEAEEFLKIYGLDPVTIPPNQPTLREDHEDMVYVTEQAKLNAIARNIKQLNAKGQPVLVGTASIESSEKISKILAKNKIKHSVLNAKQHEKEATIIAQAGKVGAVTVATNMAGRGTDIILGGTKGDRAEENWQVENRKVQEFGGLHIIGTERHEARRIDNQLRGRSGRQGDPGSSQFYVSLEDDIIKRFGGERVKSLMEWAGLEEDQAIQNKMVNKAFENAQTRVEGHNFEIRKHLVQYDDVINRQREIVYAERSKALGSESLKPAIKSMVMDEVTDLFESTVKGKEKFEWDIETLMQSLDNLVGGAPKLNHRSLKFDSQEELLNEIDSSIELSYEEREKTIESDNMRQLERIVLLKTVDDLWVQHLTSMEQMRLGIGLHAYGQRDPLVMYRQEGHSMFKGFLDQVRHQIATSIFNITVQTNTSDRLKQNNQALEYDKAPGSTGNNQISVMEKPPAKIGRNDPCHCGSGLKFKRCHGKTA